MRSLTHRWPALLLGMAIMFAAGLTAHAQNATPSSNPPATNPSSSKAELAKMIDLHTSKGVITIELDHEHAPATAANFLQYVEDGFYNGVIFHRVIPNFMIQGGGMEPGMKEKKTRAPIKNEADNGLKNVLGSVAMARTSDPHSASAQFFINTKDNAFLNYSAPNAQGWGYCVFGKVVKGMDVVEEIAKVKTGNSGFHQDVPLEDVVIIKAEVSKPASPAK